MLKEMLKGAQLTPNDVEGRVAEIDLLPDEPGCPAWMKWKIVPPRETQDDLKASRKGKKFDEDKFARLNARRCCVGIYGLTVDIIQEYGIMPLSADQAAALRSQHAGEIEMTPDDIQMLVRGSRTITARFVELQETSAVLDAEDSLRKKRSSAGSGTGD